MGKSRARRRMPKTQTARMEAIGACAAHLADLRRAHGGPPPDVALAAGFHPRPIASPPPSSYCVSPAALCAELAE
jgi:hypothetical protein